MFLTVTFALEVLMTVDAATVFRCHPWVCRKSEKKIGYER